MSTVRYTKGEVGERPWGRWEVLDTGDQFCVKRIEVVPSGRLSLQFHHHRCEDWFVVSGVATVELEEICNLMKAGERIHIPLGARHRVSNSGQTMLTFIEVQYGEILDENDIVRLEDDYGRSA